MTETSPPIGPAASPIRARASDGLTWAGIAWEEERAGCVLLHGWLDNANSFARFGPALRRPAVAFDLPGHGLSDHAPPGPLGPYFGWVERLDALLDVWGADERAVDLVGHSMGGGIATLYAACRPERVRRVVTLDALGPLSEDPSGAVRRAQRALRAPPASPPRPAPDREMAYTRAERARGEIDKESVRLIVDRALAPRPEGGFAWRHDARLQGISPLRMTEPQVIAFLEGIEAPTLVVRASRGVKVYEGVWDRRLAALRDARSVLVDGGHHVHADRFDELAALVAAFLDEPDARDAHDLATSPRSAR